MNRSPVAPIAALVAIAAAIGPVACKRDEPVQAAPIAAPGAGLPQLPQGAPPPLMAQPQGLSEVGQRIAAAQAVLAKDPKNAKVWISLGNDYFDTHQAQLSVDAYAKALALEPNNPDVLTDQGVMYRELNKFNEAVANFDKASKLNPRHVQSLYNAGVVYGYDLHDQKKAVEYFNKVIAANPLSPQAGQARTAIQGFSPASK